MVAGILAGIFVTPGTDIMLHATGVFPPWGLLLATAYRMVYGIAASYIIARLALYWPMQHALVGGIVGRLLSTGGALVTCNRGLAFGPHWYPLALMVTAMPCAWAGGKLRVLQLCAAASGPPLVANRVHTSFTFM